MKKEVKGIHISYDVSKVDIDDEKHLLDSLWKHVLPIKGIQAQHYFKVIDDVSIAMARTSTSDLLIVRIKGCIERDSDYDSEDLQPLATLMAEIKKANIEKG